MPGVHSIVTLISPVLQALSLQMHDSLTEWAAAVALFPSSFSLLSDTALLFDLSLLSF